jgi:Ran GTPase-activating protein (RanGAP) involved in mRNA processing and transport
MSDEPELVQVWSCQGWDLAQIYKSKLEAAEIPVLLKYESAGLVFGLTVDGLGQVRILVPEEYAAEAEEVLHDVVEAVEEEGEKEEEEEEEEEAEEASE